jgi:two-component system, LytTR family, response regulator
MEKLLIKVGNSLVLINKEDVDWIESEGNYSRVHIGEKSYILRQTLSGMEEKLNSKMFVRINRSIIVNTDRIRKIEMLRHRDYAVICHDDQTWTWGRGFRKNLNEFINNQIKVY